MGWNNAPDYTPPNPPKWIWGVIVGVATLLVIVALSNH